MREFLTAILVLSLIGLGASALLHLALAACALWQWVEPSAHGEPSRLARLIRADWPMVALFVGCFVVAFPALLAVRSAGRGHSDRHFWRKIVLPALPAWMRAVFYVLLVYSVAAFCGVLVLLQVTAADTKLLMGAVFTAAFMALYFGHFMLLYYRLYANGRPGGDGDGRALE
jgi:hypothetical protein